MSAISINQLFGVQGIVAVITGGGTGIGRMMANAFDENGAEKVYIVGRRRDKLQEVADAAKNGSIVPLEGDVTLKESLEAVTNKIRSDIGFVNVVIANSGYSGPGLEGLPDEPTISDIQKHVMSQPVEEFTRTFDVNVTGVMYTGIAFLELLDAGNKKRNMPPGVRSQIITTSSIGGFNKIPSMGFAYNTSKAAVTHLTKMLSLYLGPHSIRVNALAPGRKFSPIFVTR